MHCPFPLPKNVRSGKYGRAVGPAAPAGMRRTRTRPLVGQAARSSSLSSICFCISSMPKMKEIFSALGCTAPRSTGY